MSEKITVTYEIPAPPKGWGYDCARKASRKGELYFNGSDWAEWEFDSETDGIYPIAIAIAIRTPQWRPATEADVGRTDARFFDHPEHPYCIGKLLHAGRGNFVAISDGKYGELFKRDHASNWKYCEVPTEPTK